MYWYNELEREDERNNLLDEAHECYPDDYDCDDDGDWDLDEHRSL